MYICLRRLYLRRFCRLIFWIFRRFGYFDVLSVDVWIFRRFGYFDLLSVDVLSVDVFEFLQFSMFCLSTFCLLTFCLSTFWGGTYILWRLRQFNPIQKCSSSVPIPEIFVPIFWWKNGRNCLTAECMTIPFSSLSI
jgi:hypothetical protein